MRALMRSNTPPTARAASPRGRSSRITLTAPDMRTAAVKVQKVPRVVTNSRTSHTAANSPSRSRVYLATAIAFDERGLDTFLRYASPGGPASPAPSRTLEVRSPIPGPRSRESVDAQGCGRLASDRALHLLHHRRAPDPLEPDSLVAQVGLVPDRRPGTHHRRRAVDDLRPDVAGIWQVAPTSPSGSR